MRGITLGWLFVLLIHSEYRLGAEPFMHGLLQRLEGDMAMSLSSLQFLKLDPSVRAKAAEALVPVSKMKVHPLPGFAQVDLGSRSAFRICCTFCS